MPRLPIPGADNGTWGQILNDFLAAAHNADGTIKAGAVTKSDVGLGNVDNTSDADKPMSNAVALALSQLSRTVSTQPPSGTPADNEEWIIYNP